MPQVVGIGLPRGRGRKLFRLVARGSNSSPSTSTGVAIGPVFATVASPGVSVPPLQSLQALRIVRYFLSVVDSGNSNALFNAQPPIIQLQVNPFGLTNAVLSWSTDCFGGTGAAGATPQGMLSAVGTQFMLTDEWLEYDDYNQSLKNYTSAAIQAIQNQNLRMVSNVRVWNSSGAAQNVTLNEVLLWEIWQKRLNGDL